MKEIAELISDVRSFPLSRYLTHDRAPETFLFVAMYCQEQTKHKDL
jgi:hypothetical protein